eukprot:7890529-Prorocentrum_lima.AAC.1
MEFASDESSAYFEKQMYYLFGNSPTLSPLEKGMRQAIQWMKLAEEEKDAGVSVTAVVLHEGICYCC